MKCDHPSKLAHRKTIISKLPEVLIIQLKRFSCDGRWLEKIHTAVKCPLELDMGRYTGNNKENRYQLYSIVNHIGGPSGGHYTATCQDPTNEKIWFCYNDDKTSAAIDNKNVTTEKSYILFYKKKGEEAPTDMADIPVNGATGERELDNEIDEGETPKNSKTDVNENREVDKMEKANEVNGKSDEKKMEDGEHKNTDTNAEVRRSKRDHKLTAKVRSDVSEETGKENIKGKCIQKVPEKNEKITKIDVPKDATVENKQVFCLCNKPYDKTKPMLHCKTCDGWFHGGCVKYKCTQCTDKEEELKRIRNIRIKEENKEIRNERDHLKGSIKDMEKKIKELEGSLKKMEKEKTEMMKREDKLGEKLAEKDNEREVIEKEREKEKLTLMKELKNKEAEMGISTKLNQQLKNQLYQTEQDMRKEGMQSTRDQTVDASVQCVLESRQKDIDLAPVTTTNDEGTEENKKRTNELEEIVNKMKQKIEEKDQVSRDKDKEITRLIDQTAGYKNRLENVLGDVSMKEKTITI